MAVGSCEVDRIIKIKVNKSRLKVCFNGFRMRAADESCFVEVGKVFVLKN